VWAGRGTVRAVTTTPPVHTRLAFWLLAVRPRAEWRAWAESAVARRWSWIVGARVGFGLTMGGVLLLASQLWGNTRFELPFLWRFVLVMCLLLIPLAVVLNDDERARRREVARIYGMRRKGPAQLAAEATSLFIAALLLVTDGGRRFSGPLLDGVQWALFAALVIATFWFFHERRVLDRDLDLRSTRLDST